MNNLAHAFSRFSVLPVFLSASLRISQLYWPSGQLCFGGSARSTHPSRYKAFLLPGAWLPVCLLPPCPHNFTCLTNPSPTISSSPQETCFFCSKCKYFISNLMLLLLWDILARIARMSLSLTCCRQVFNMAEPPLSHTPQNLKLLFKPLACWGLWSAYGV